MLDVIQTDNNQDLSRKLRQLKTAECSKGQNIAKHGCKLWNLCKGCNFYSRQIIFSENSCHSSAKLWYMGGAVTTGFGRAWRNMRFCQPRTWPTLSSSTQFIGHDVASVGICYMTHLPGNECRSLDFDCLQDLHFQLGGDTARGWSSQFSSRQSSKSLCCRLDWS